VTVTAAGQNMPAGTETTIYIGGGLFERITKPSGVTEYKHAFMAGTEPVAIRTLRSNSSNDIRYLHRDHLNSLDAITNEGGTVVTRLSYDAFGKRRDAGTWAAAPGTTTWTTIAGVTHRGYTSHEHLDNVDLIHMNGRVYDPLIGRFLSADPIVQSPLLSQSLNRYSYVMNNPLSMVDPSGFSWLSKAFRSIGRFLKKWGATIIAIVFTVMGMPFLGSFLGSVFSTVVNGGNLTSFLKGFAIGAVAGAIAGPIAGRLAGALGVTGARIGAQIFQGALAGGIAGGISSSLMGGSFWSGFTGGALTGGITAGFVARYGNGIEPDGQPALESTSKLRWALMKLDRATAQILGKIWNLPNTVVGLTIGLAGVPFGARIQFGDNGIEFINYPWGKPGALTMGNVILYHEAVPSDIVPRYDYSANVRLGTHERGHTYQGQVLGPLFGPVYLLSGGAFTGRSPFEIAADNFAGGSGSWWPWKKN
jgi:RHS repeat-associated protein